MAAQIHNTLGIAYFYQGRYDAALVAYREAQHIHQTLGSAYEEGDVLINISLVYSAVGMHQLASETAQQALERAESIQSQRLKAEALIAQAEALLLVNQPADVIQAATAALELAAQLGSSYDQAIALRLLGQASARNQIPFAAYFEQSITLLNTIKHSFGLARTWAEYGRALIESGNNRDGSAYVMQAHEAFTAIGALGELARITQES
jgi:tetratricopeptide (TPR) repeat protein